MSYIEEQQKNREQFMTICKTLRPEIFSMIIRLDEVGVNPDVMFHTINAIERITTGARYGNVKLIIEDNICRFIYSEGMTKVNAPILE